MLLHADVFLMQNYEHVARVIALLNTTPTQTRDTDFSRVRPYLLDGLGGRLRQTIIMARHDAPQLRGWDSPRPPLPLPLPPPLPLLPPAPLLPARGGALFRHSPNSHTGPHTPPNSTRTSLLAPTRPRHTHTHLPCRPPTHPHHSLPRPPHSLALRQCRNAAGRVVVSLPCTGGGLAAVPEGTRQLFLRFEAASPAGVDDARMEAFKVRRGLGYGGWLQGGEGLGEKGRRKIFKVGEVWGRGVKVGWEGGLQGRVGQGGGVMCVGRRKGYFQVRGTGVERTGVERGGGPSG